MVLGRSYCNICVAPSNHNLVSGIEGVEMYSNSCGTEAIVRQEDDVRTFTPYPASYTPFYV